MMSFRAHRLADAPLPGATVWLLTDIAELRGRQAAIPPGSRPPELLKRLRETALVQSVESSNRIEGVEVERDRLAPLVLGDARPLNRSEEEVLGYRRALSLIDERGHELPISPDTIRRLHALAQEGAGDAGQWKTRDNQILEFPAGGGPPKVRFTPLAAAETPAAIAELCHWYADAVDQRKVPPPVAVAALVLDFLCVHPFRDGNGRVARLLTLLALNQNAFDVGRFVSLERLIEESKADYYETLKVSSQGWHDGRHDLWPWTNYFLAILRRAYLELARQAGA